MSTVSAQPQLDSDDLRQTAWLLGSALGLLALSSLLYFEAGTWLLVAAGFALIPLVLWRPELLARVPAWAHKLVFPVLAAWLVFDLHAHREPLASAVRLDAGLLLYRCCHYRRRRDDLQLILLGLFLVVMAGVATASALFAAQIVAFAGLALLLLLVLNLLEAREGGKGETKAGGVPGWARRPWRTFFRKLAKAGDWRIVALGGGLFAGFVVLSAVLFMSIPRFQLDSGFALDGLMRNKSHTGFSDVLRFDDVTDIQQDNGVALRVEIPNRARMPAVPYWRMVVLDEYKAGTFQMSAALKRAAFFRPVTVAHLDGPEPAGRSGSEAWTFYLEPGVGRYLALGSGFSRLVFAEPQTCQWSPWLRVAALEREPASMKAYRVEGLTAADRVADNPAGLSIGEIDTLRGSMSATGLTGPDQASLQAVAEEIDGGRNLPAEDFARETMRWLARRHGYSLHSALPAGQGDPLVRWLVSREPGHCELFAGAFVLLSRAAGHPARLVTGFVGGSWNEDYLIVRNAEAHAWCEIHAGAGQWLRVDPTNDGPRLLGSERGAATAASAVRTMPPGWAAWLDRLRMAWYRRVVSFDETEQRRLMQSLRDAAGGAGSVLRAWSGEWAERLRTWLARPWSPGRATGTVLGFLGGGALLYLSIRYGRRWRFGRRRGAGPDPVRAEAGRWLRRWAEPGVGAAGETLHGELVRLRYGRRDTWPEPAKVFREAALAWRSRR